ncbi:MULTISPECIES: hypothetical protein [Xanthomonas]|uniref:DUF86 domain-containing protein n=1 Tax=Xanthomonas dyei TaxID=743699 RepID=A0ABZ0D9Q8_9XANT|nr:hypothetical protein [Xanthomonas dyei]WOB26947.1 hypothetical protein NYR99_02875 [Xanthomonas dyei]WOB54567.1 hypothetical protein NYR95_02880 [Xanthomonas dyei]
MSDEMPSTVKEEFARRLERYQALNMLERFGVYMGTVQLLEIRLKAVLVSQFDQDSDSLERRTLGAARVLFEQKGVRPDFTLGLQAVVDDRNHVAHALLAEHELTERIGGFPDHILPWTERWLDKAIYQLEHFCCFCEFVLTNDLLMPEQ